MIQIVILEGKLSAACVSGRRDKDTILINVTEKYVGGREKFSLGERELHLSPISCKQQYAVRNGNT